ncbi:MAG: hypothetical protein AB1Z65_10550 [Candidatus Sulfomarinibacteraceae bacterium]
MRRSTIAVVVFALIATVSLTACGPEETPEQRLERLRYNHVIYPVGTTTLHDDEGNPTLLVDLNVANQGTEPLTALTVLVRVKDGLGNLRLEQRVTVPLEDLRPGIGRQQDVRIAGFALGEDDEITVEIEKNLAPEDLRSLPEFADVSGG